MTVRRVLAIIVLAIIAVVMPSSASASITPTPETRVGVFDLRESFFVGPITSRGSEIHRARSLCDLRRALEHSLRWKGMWRFDLGGGVELYDARARMWSPKLGTFLSVDEFDFHDPTSTLWAWPNQNPVTFSDPSGRDGTTNNPVQDLVDSGFLPPGLTLFGKGTRMRASGIAMMANDATVEQGMAKMNCGNAIIAAGAGVLAADAQVIAGAADAAVGAANMLRGGGSYRSVRSVNKGGEVHHMPSWNSLKQMGDKNPFSHGGAPGILMEKGDHMLTASWGRGGRGPSLAGRERSDAQRGALPGCPRTRHHRRANQVPREVRCADRGDAESPLGTLTERRGKRDGVGDPPFAIRGTGRFRDASR